MNIRYYCACLALMMVTLAIGNRFWQAEATLHPPLPEWRQTEGKFDSQRFTAKDAIGRAITLSRQLASEKIALESASLQWAAFPQMTHRSNGVSRPLWKVDGHKASGGPSVHVTLDADSGELLWFSYSDRGDNTVGQQRMSREATVRIARQWLHAYEKTNPADAAAPSLPAAPWRLVSVSQASSVGRSVCFSSRERRVRISVHPVSGELLLFSFQRGP